MSPRESTPTPTPWTWRLSLPHSIAFDDDGKLYVADRSNKRIQIFTPDGDFLGQWTGMGGPRRPVKLAHDPAPRYAGRGAAGRDGIAGG